MTNVQALCSAPIFVVGAPRSGTTLLQYMLRSHPELSLPTAESHFFIPFYKRQHEFTALEKKDNLRKLISEIYLSKKQFFDEDFHGIKFDLDKLTDQLYKQNTTTIPGVINGIFSANALAQGKSRWGEKTPYYILHLETILEMFPDAKIVHIIRDGRDCALSMLERRWDLGIFNIYHAAYTWNKYVLSGKDFGNRHPDCYFEFRYEDLLDTPEKIVKSLCQTIDLKYDSSLINFKQSTFPGRTPLLTQPLQSNNKFKWKTQMTKSDVKIFESMTHNLLSAYGYELQNHSETISEYRRLMYETHIKLCNYLLYFSK